MDPKLTMLFVLFAGIIALSHLTDERIDRMKRRFKLPRRPLRAAPVMKT